MLGIDIGTSRVRVAVACSRSARAAGAIASRDVPPGAVNRGVVGEPELVGALIEEARAELGVRERRCVCAVGSPAASLRVVRFPAKMSAFERTRAARLDVERRLGAASKESIVRLQPIPGSVELFAAGVVSNRALASRLATLRNAGLRAAAVDFEGTALKRSFPEADAIVDVGVERTTLHVVADVTMTLQLDCGGQAITEAIGRELGLDDHSAEARKRTIGTAGAGEGARETLVHDVVDLIESARRRRCSIERVALVGNGSRIDRLREDLERAARVRVNLRPPNSLDPDAFPADVALAAAPDWALAAALATWGRA